MLRPKSGELLKMTLDAHTPYLKHFSVILISDIFQKAFLFLPQLIQIHEILLQCQALTRTADESSALVDLIFQ